MIDLRNNKKGFTLVELSIVLVIIGLIVGGVLVGQDMINAAKSRSTVAQLEKYNSAVNTFQEKYGELPGDYDLAAQNITVNTLDGDANGVIFEDSGPVLALPTQTDSVGTTNTDPNELPLFFEHLSAANLIDGNFDGAEGSIAVGQNYPIPKTGTGGMLAYSSVDGLKYWHIGLSDNSTDNALTFANNLRADEAFSIDSKMDDGDPDLGIVLAMGGLEALPSIAADGTDLTTDCVSDYTVAPTNINTGFANPSEGEYLLAAQGQFCQLRIRMN